MKQAGTASIIRQSITYGKIAGTSASNARKPVGGDPGTWKPDRADPSSFVCLSRFSEANRMVWKASRGESPVCESE